MLKAEYECQSSHWKFLRVEPAQKLQVCIYICTFYSDKRNRTRVNIVNNFDGSRQIQAYLRHVAGSVPDYHNKAGIAVK